MKKLAFIIAALVAQAPAARAVAPVVPVGEASKAVTDEIIDAIAEEMNRAMQQLEIPGAPKPYFIAYKVTEVDVNHAAASLGQTTSKENQHFVTLEARVRIGSPKLDNSNFVIPQGESIDGVSTISLPLEATPRIARRSAWLVTDTAYKEALYQLQAKLDSRRSGGTGRRDVPSLSGAAEDGKAPATRPVIDDKPVLVPALESIEDLEKRAKQVSAVFRDQAGIRESRAALTSYLERRWYLSTEGTSVTDTRRASGVVIAASGQADDGQPLADYFLRYGHTAKDLPNDKELESEAKTIAANIAALAKAPVLEKYSGPVLFEGEGAVGIVRSTLAPQLGGTPLAEGGSANDPYAGGLVDLVGVRAFSPLLSMVDDPTATTGGGKALIGSYKVDDEGTAAQRVEVAKAGLLSTLLNSRTPANKDDLSNGHARVQGEGGVFRGSATNLFITAKGAVTRKALQAKLVAAGKSEKLPFTLVITRFDDAAITGAPEYAQRELVQLYSQRDKVLKLPPPAILAYKVLPNGKRELVRGVQLREIPITVWKDNVVAASKETTTYNFLASNQPELLLRLSGGTDNGYVPSGGIESAVITPDILLKSLTLTGSSVPERAAPVIAPPKQ